MTMTLTNPEPTVLSVGSLQLLVEEQRLIGPRGELRLNGTHFRVLRRLMRRPGVIISHSDLIGEMYPNPDDEGENSEIFLRQVILALRQALVLLIGSGRVAINNEAKIGYVIERRAVNRVLEGELV